jgi:hexokinase
MSYLPTLYTKKELQQFTTNFISEMALGQKSIDKSQNHSSVGYHIVPLPLQGLVANGEIFQTIVMGGSVLEIGKIQNDDGKVKILEYTTKSIPLIDNKQVMMAVLEENLLPDAKVLSLNFAYPVEFVSRDGRMDARMITGAKQHQFEGVVGNLVGEMIEQFFASKGRFIKVNVANDTVCLASACLNYFDSHSAVAGIIGTGVNFAFMQDAGTVVNLESGNFDKLEQSETAKIIDPLSTTPNKFWLEKEVPIQSRMALTILERSAQLTAVKIAGIYRWKNVPKLNILMEGSVFWHGYNYIPFVQYYLRVLGIEPTNIHFERVLQSSTIGAGKIVIG